MDPWIQPIYQNMYSLYDKVKVEKLIEDGKIEIVPLAFMRGRTFLDSCIIVDDFNSYRFKIKNGSLWG